MPGFLNKLRYALSKEWKNDSAWLYAVLSLAAFTNAVGLFATILEPDAALYATIAKTIVQRHDFVNLLVEGEDWLDKPHSLSG